MTLNTAGVSKSSLLNILYLKINNCRYEIMPKFGSHCSIINCVSTDKVFRFFLANCSGREISQAFENELYNISFSLKTINWDN